MRTAKQIRADADNIKVLLFADNGGSDTVIALKCVVHALADVCERLDCIHEELEKKADK